MSSDEDAVIKEEAMAFKVKYDEMTNNAKQNVTIAGKVRAIAPKDWNEIYGKATEYKDNIYNRNLVAYVLKKLTKRHLSITETWEDWVKVAFAIASNLHPEKGKELFLQLCRLDGVNHDEAKSERLIWDAYSLNKGRCSIKTIKYERLKSYLEEINLSLTSKDFPGGGEQQQSQLADLIKQANQI